RQWEGIDIRDVKALWAHELAAYERRLDAIAWALDHLPPKCPNLVEFRDLCRQAPRHEPLALPDVPADPERVKAELARLGHQPPDQRQAAPRDHKAWARRIVERHKAGERVRAVALRMATEALRAS
ncbi:MAG: hypothetical protein N2690_05365, partial [Rhodocyclaceae bacterium]|nr:hypothetical protein [Rhodocyclaceae bacterium]